MIWAFLGGSMFTLVIFAIGFGLGVFYQKRNSILTASEVQPLVTSSPKENSPPNELPKQDLSQPLKSMTPQQRLNDENREIINRINELLE